MSGELDAIVLALPIFRGGKHNTSSQAEVQEYQPLVPFELEHAEVKPHPGPHIPPHQPQEFQGALPKG
jgi:hypothetical protein